MARSPRTPCARSFGAPESSSSGTRRASRASCSRRPSRSPSKAAHAPHPGVATRDDLVIVGRVRRPHGVRGEVLIEPLTDEPDAVYASGRRVFGGAVDGPMHDDAPTLTGIETRPVQAGLLVRSPAAGDRPAAAARS